MDNSVMMARIEDLLRQRRLMKKELSLATGISGQTFLNWKAGMTPSPIYVQKVADFFGVSYEYLIGKENAATQEDDGKEDVIQRISDLLMRVDLQTLHAVRDFADGLIRWREFQQSSTAPESEKKDN